MIHSFLINHKKATPILYRNDSNGILAHKAADIISDRALYFNLVYLKNMDHCIKAADDIRKRRNTILNDVNFDKLVSKVLKNIIKINRDYMNSCSTDSGGHNVYLDCLRRKMGIELKYMKDHLGCKFDGSINNIIP